VSCIGAGFFVAPIKFGFVCDCDCVMFVLCCCAIWAVHVCWLLNIIAIGDCLATDVVTAADVGTGPVTLGDGAESVNFTRSS
jgi:hypothetical protein